MIASMDSRALLDTIDKAPAGTRIVYHTGHLMYDRAIGEHFMAVHATACVAWEAMEAGMVLLVQRRVAPGRYDYIAIKQPAPFKPVEWWGPYAAFGTKHSKPKANRPAPVDAVVVGELAARRARTPAPTHA